MRTLFLFGFLWGQSFVGGSQAKDLPISLSLPSGLYMPAAWKDDWPNCVYEDGIAEGRVNLIERDGVAALRVLYPPKAIGSDKSGASWRYPFPRQESAEVKYTVRFDEDFDFVKGGKLPGLCGGPMTVTGGDKVDGLEGFSARLMWRADGRGEAYVYHMNQPDKYGDQIPFPDDFRFPRGESVQVRLQIIMNTPGERDGELRVWITTPSGSEPKLVVEKTDLELRAEDRYGVDGLLFNTFFGGSSSEWAPKKEEFAEFSQFHLILPADL